MSPFKQTRAGQLELTLLREYLTFDCHTPGKPETVYVSSFPRAVCDERPSFRRANGVEMSFVHRGTEIDSEVLYGLGEITAQGCRHYRYRGAPIGLP
jgi:hypothetical protein